MTLAIDEISTANGRLQQRPADSRSTARPAEPGQPEQFTAAEPAPRRPDPWRVNVHPTERVASCLLGGTLVGLGIANPSPLRLVGALFGVGFLTRGLSGHCMGYAVMNRSTALPRPAAPEEYYRDAVHLESSVTVTKPAQELFAYWRNLSHLPTFMDGLDSVTILDDKRSHWIARAPAGTSVQWDAEIIAEDPGRLIAWRSLADADVDNAGSVRFVDAPGNRGTEVRVVIDYIPPAGRLGAAVARIFGRDAKSQVREDLRRFKQLMELGELPTILGQARGSKC